MNIKRHIRSRKILVSRPVLSDFGVLKAKSDSLDCLKEEKDTTTMMTSRKSSVKSKKINCKSVIEKEQLSMPECPLPNKRMTLKGKSVSSKGTTQKRKSSRTSVARSTTKGKVCGSYWTKLISEVSTSWRSSTKIDSADLRTTYSNTSSNSKELQSKWFPCKATKIQSSSILNKKWRKISSQLLTTSLPKITEEDQEETNEEEEKIEKKEKAARVFKYRIYPDDDLIKTYNHAFHTRRFIRNHVLAYIKRYSAKASLYNKDKSVSPLADPNNPDDVTLILNKDGKAQLIPGLTELSRRFINDTAPLIKTTTWLQNYYYDFRSEVIRDLLKDYKSSFARAKKAKKSFDMHFQSKKQDKIKGCSFTIHAKHWNNEWWQRFKPKDLFCRNKRSGNKLPSEIEYAAKLKRYPDGSYFILIPTAMPPLKRSKRNLLVIDPGYRTCFTGINFRDNVLEEIGDGMSHIISRKLHHMNKLKSLINRKARETKVRTLVKEIDEKVTHSRHYAFNHRKRYHMKRALTRMSARVSNMIDDLHKSSAKYMCENYSTIVIPKLDFHTFKGISKRQKSMTARVAHCRFVDYLRNKSKQYENNNVIVVDEAYTSKTCSRCGHWHAKLGALKEFVCPNCHIELGRDENAVYNILMKTIHDKQSLCLGSKTKTLGLNPLLD